MIIRILDKTEGLLRLEIEGEGHTLCNLLQTVLLMNPGVEMAGYDKQHPLMDTTILYVRTKENSTPESVLIQAADAGHHMADDFLESLESELGVE